jgi:hypothetical protein
MLGEAWTRSQFRSSTSSKRAQTTALYQLAESPHDEGRRDFTIAARTATWRSAYDSDSIRTRPGPPDQKGIERIAAARGEGHRIRIDGIGVPML